MAVTTFNVICMKTDKDSKLVKKKKYRNRCENILWFEIVRYGKELYIHIVFELHAFIIFV